MQLANKRIGIFDSGVGGLAIAQVIWQSLPGYSYIYLGDTKHVPFGDRSQEVIYEYTRQAVEYLFKQNCQLIILACNTASAEALRRIQEEYLPAHYPDRRVLGVIIPTIEAALKPPDSQVEQFIEPVEVLGVMATSSTVESGAYMREALKIRPNLKIIQLATPLLVPIIEQGDLDLTDNLLKQYLEYFKSQKVQKLILGCTHYVLLKDKIRNLADWPVEIIAQDEIIPFKLKDYLNRHLEITDLLEKNGQCDIQVTDLTEGIKSLMSRFTCVHQESKLQLVKLQSLEPSFVKKEVAASTITTMKNGGKVEYLAEPKDLEELKLVLDWAKTQALSIKIIGGGSDVLLSEAGFTGLLLHPANRSLEFLEGGKVKVGAGMAFGQLVALCLQKGLVGLEYFARIPCQVGGAIYNNIHGLEGHLISQLVTEVTSIDLNQFLVKHFQPQELDFAYDQSIFQQNGQLIYEVTLQLKPQSTTETQERQAYYLEQSKIKSQKQPAGPNAGSVFKNLAKPVEGDNKAAAWYIDQCGLKGLRIGGMQVDLKHANFIVNVDHGTQTDFILLVKQIQTRVQEKFGFRLEPEVECWQVDGEKIKW
jgi:glutamate racemase